MLQLDLLLPIKKVGMEGLSDFYWEWENQVSKKKKQIKIKHLKAYWAVSGVVTFNLEHISLLF